MTSASARLDSRSCLRRDNVAHQSGLTGSPRRHPLINPDEAHPHQVPERHPVGQQDWLIDSRHREAHMRIKKRGALRRDDDVALAEEVEPSATRHAVHCGNHRLPQPLTLRADLLARIVVGEGIEFLVGRNIATIDARAERSISGAGQDDNPYRIVEANVAPERSELVLHPLVERIVDFRPIQCHLCDVITNVVCDRSETIRYDHGAHRLNVSNAGNVAAPCLTLSLF